MSFAAPLGFLALLALPLLLWLHSYRRRLPQRRVAALFLFAPDALRADAGRQRTRLLRSPSLWCELLAACLFALWLAAPQAGPSQVRHLVAVLDDTASMAAGGAARASTALQQLAGQLAANDRLSVLTSGRQPRFLLGPRGRVDGLAAALQDYRPAAAGHDLAPALAIARELVEAGGEIHLFTDELPTQAAADLELHGFGLPMPNHAILVAQRWPVADGGELVRLVVASFGAGGPLALQLQLDGVELPTRTLDTSIGPAELELPLPPGSGVLWAALPADALQLDNEVWLLPAPLPVVAVADLLPPERRQQLQLAAVFAALPAHQPAADPATAQLLLTERPLPPRNRQLQVVLPRGDDAGDSYAGPYLLDRNHPWLQTLPGEGLLWRCWRLELPGQPLCSVGSQVLLSDELLPTTRRLWINLDGRVGNVVRAPDWPLLFANLLQSLRAAVPGPGAPNVRLGEEVHYTLAAGLEASAAAPLWLRDPEGELLSAAAGEQLSWLPQRAGLHRVVDAAGQQIAEFAVRFHDPAESDLQRLSTFRIAAQRAASLLLDREDAWLQRWLLLLLLALLALDWWLLAGRSS